MLKRATVFSISNPFHAAQQKKKKKWRATMQTLLYVSVDLGLKTILISKKLTPLWLAGEGGNHVGINGTKADEGCSTFQRRSY